MGSSHGPPRFWIDAPLSPGAETALPEAAVRHVAALRLRPGDAVILFDGSGGEHEATLVRMDRGRSSARIGGKRDIERESPLSVTLALGISAGERMDYSIQKAVELGAAGIVPLSTERSVVHLSEERADRRLVHWRRVAASACEQCGRNRLPRIDSVAGLDEFLSRAHEGLKLIFSPEGTHRISGMAPARSVIVLIGPEGGLSAREREAARTAGFLALRFGPRILRTETAPVAALAAIQALWGDC